MSKETNNPFTILRDEITTAVRSDLLDIKSELKKEMEQIKKSAGADGAIYGNAGDAAKRFGVSANTVRNWGRSGHIKKSMVGGVSLYSFEEIEHFIRSKSMGNEM